MIIRINQYHLMPTRAGTTWIQDARISAGAKGIYGYLTSFPDDRATDIGELCTHFANSRNSIYCYLKELRKLGYLTRHQDRDVQMGNVNLCSAQQRRVIV